MLPSCCTDETDVKRVNVVWNSHTTIPLVPLCVRILCHCPMSWKPELIYLRDCNLITTRLYYYEMRSSTFENVYCFLTEEAMFLLIFFFFEILVWEYSEYSKTSRNLYVSVRRVCVCVRFSTFQTPITHKRIEISTWILVYQWSNHNPLIVTIFMTINAQFMILWDFECFKKRTW